MTEPEVGMYLHASCSAEDYGRIVAVGKDANDHPTIDIEIFHPDDLVDCEDDKEIGSVNPLTRLEVVGEAKLILRDVQYQVSDNSPGYAPRIVCNTPGNNCYRCTKLFAMFKESDETRAERYRRGEEIEW